MVKQHAQSSAPRGPSETEPMRFHCVLQIPKDEAAKLLPQLEVALDCGGGDVRRKGRLVEVETDLDVHAMISIVDKDIPILVTKHIPTKPLPKEMLIDDPDLWFKTIGREK